jgi:quercetin dioxygenase-like cupin family protein
MHNQQQQQYHLKTNNIISKLAVIILSIVLLTGLALVPALQIGVNGQVQQQQQQDQAAPFIVQNTSESMQDPLQGNATNQTSKVEIRRSGSQPSTIGPAEYFTGSVRIDPLFEAKDPARVVAATVTFEPGAHTAWHSHPLGQILIVTAGCGLIQVGDGPVEEICSGDVIWTPAGERHWHGATPTTAMTHIAIQEELNGTTANWMEKVSDEQYPGS